MGLAIGARINDVLTETDLAYRGNGMALGTVVHHAGGEYMCVKAAASQNLINGMVIYIDGSFNATVVAAGAVAPSSTSGAQMMGVAVCSITASASQIFFAQIFGQGQVIVDSTTASNLPNHILIPGSTAGYVHGAIATASSYISGLTLTATGSVANTLTNCFINYPKMAVA